MKERIVTFALALGALVLFYALFVPKPAGQREIAWPVSTEIRDQGYQALWRWLQAQGVPVLSFRDRYGQLSRQDLPESGNVLIATLPQKGPAGPPETAELTEWIGRGNTLLVLAALDDTPRWALAAGGSPLVQLRLITGLDFQAIPEKKPAEGEAESGSRTATLRRAVQQLVLSQRSTLIAKGEHPLFTGVRSVAAHSELPASRWIVANNAASGVLELGERRDRAQGSDSPEPAVWLQRRGQGQVIVLAFASPFSNALIGEEDNARLFANIIGWSRSVGGTVLFDDSHQGLVSYYDAKAFFADSRLHRTLLWIGALWLLFVLGWQRLRPHADGWRPMDITTFISVTGGFIASRVAPDEVGRRLFENFFNRIRKRIALPQDGLPVWDWLDTQASLAGPDLAQLRMLHARTQAHQRIDLVRLQNCLTKVMGKLE